MNENCAPLQFNLRAGRPHLNERTKMAKDPPSLSSLCERERNKRIFLCLVCTRIITGAQWGNWKRTGEHGTRKRFESMGDNYNIIVGPGLPSLY